MDYTPHIAPNGILKWYEGDSFDISWVITLTRDGVPLVFAADDEIRIAFYDFNKNEITSFTFNNIGSDNKILLSMTPELSAKFAVGQYTYCIKYVDSANSGYITTVAANRIAEVSACH